MTSSLKITCRRCKGTGFTGHVVMYAGAPGTCFACAGAGEVYKDKFHRAFGVSKTFYGVTESRYLNPNNPNNGVFKLLSTDRPLAVCKLDYRGRCASITEYVEITEAQARQFWSRYGERTQLGGVRVADFEGHA